MQSTAFDPEAYKANTLELDSAADRLAFERQSSGALRETLSSLSDAAQEETRREGACP